MSVNAKTGYSELVLVAAEDVARLLSALERIVRFLDQAPGASLRDVAYTSAKAYKACAQKGAVLALVASSTEELRARLAAAASRIAGGVEKLRDKSGTYFFRTHLAGPGTEGKLAFMFPGATSFYPDMLRDLAIGFSQCRAAFDELEEALSESGRFSPSSFIFPPAPYYRRDADVFSAGAYAQAMVSVCSANAALYRMFTLLGIRPDGVMGFAGGDLNALAAAGYFGAFKRPARLKFLREMYTMVDSAVAHSSLPRCVMAAVVSPNPERTEAALSAFSADEVAVFFEVTPRQRMLAVRPEAFPAVQRALSEAGAKFMRLAVDRPFNTAWCEKLLPMFQKFAGHWTGAKATCPVWSCASARPLPEKGRKARDICAGTWVRPVRLGETLRNMHDDGFRVFLEVGPRDLASKAAEDVLRGREHIALFPDAVHRSGLLQFQHVVGCLAALGVPIEPEVLFAHHRCRELDFDTTLMLEVRADAEMLLQREFPSLALLSEDSPLAVHSAPGARGNKARERAAARSARERRQRQFDFGATMPLISDMEVVDETPGVSVEIATVLSFAEAPFLADAALGTAQISYADPSLRGLVLLPLSVGAEIMCEIAQLLAPRRNVVAVDGLKRRRTIAFSNSRLAILVRAERISSENPAHSLVRVELREEAAGSGLVIPAMEATVTLAAEPPAAAAVNVPPLERPRGVHWSESDIYPSRLYAGELLQHIQGAELWNDVGLDYEVEVPPSAGAVVHTRFPVWVVNPQLVQAVADGYLLWRSHERFPGAFSFAFSIHRLVLHALSLPEGQKLKCYLRLTGVTARSHICDIFVTDGNGNLVMELLGYEENTERVPGEYRKLVLQPPLAYLTEELPPEVLGAPSVPVASAMVSDIPYDIFTRNDEIWLRTVSEIVLAKIERTRFGGMAGSVQRRTEWLFGRLAAKEAVRRFLNRFHNARWTDADVEIFSDTNGKPNAVGKWQDTIVEHLDLAISHTADFVVAVFAARAHVGVDVESATRDISDEFTHGAFTSEEIALATGATNPHTTIIRFWCAKEAVSKALGTGLKYTPREMTVDSFDPDSGKIELSLRGKWAEEFKMFRGHAIEVASSIVRAHVVATCFIPSSLLEG